MEKLELKNYLLSTNVFIDNEYLSEYLDLIFDNLDKSFNCYYENHHVLPSIYYKHLYNCKTRHQSDAYAKKDKNNFIVKLLYKDHCKAHWLLYFCTKDYMKQANEAAVRYISGMYTKLTGIEKHKFEFVQEDFDLLQNYMNDIVEDEDSRYWSQSEIDYLLNNYKGYGSGPICAKYLNRSLMEINHKAQMLKLTKNCPNWSEEDENILKQYYPIEGDQVYKRIQLHSKAACRRHALKLGLKTKNHYWSEEEISILVKNFALVGPTGCSKLLNRSRSKCKHKAARLGLVFTNNPRKVWTLEKLDLLKNNMDKSVKELQNMLGIAKGTIYQKLKELKNENNDTRENKD